MGEGWGDFFATMIRMHNGKVADWSMGAWASGRPGGIRLFKYSTNLTINTDTYKVLDKPGYWGVHAIGEVWAEMLFVSYATSSCHRVVHRRDSRTDAAYPI